MLAQDGDEITAGCTVGVCLGASTLRMESKASSEPGLPCSVSCCMHWGTEHSAAGGSETGQPRGDRVQALHRKGRDAPALVKRQQLGVLCHFLKGLRFFSKTRKVWKMKWKLGIPPYSSLIFKKEKQPTAPASQEQAVLWFNCGAAVGQRCRLGSLCQWCWLCSCGNERRTCGAPKAAVQDSALLRDHCGNPSPPSPPICTGGDEQFCVCGLSLGSSEHVLIGARAEPRCHSS